MRSEILAALLIGAGIVIAPERAVICKVNNGPEFRVDASVCYPVTPLTTHCKGGKRLDGLKHSDMVTCRSLDEDGQPVAVRVYDY
jgi:hypothetical protein